MVLLVEVVQGVRHEFFATTRSVLGRTLGLVGRVALKFGVTRRMMLTVVGFLATVILVSALLAVVLLGR